MGSPTGTSPAWRGHDSIDTDAGTVGCGLVLLASDECGGEWRAGRELWRLEVSLKEEME